MKFKSIGLVLVFLICGLNVQASTECNTKLTKQHRYGDLNKTLQCLSLKIQKLEQQVATQNDRTTIPVSVNKAKMTIHRYLLVVFIAMKIFW